eukprot:TRINITY_DN9583_c0_g1_i7.p1 TRINITY_DN9583_c0_g1~~TRINITY_DN9583_c0_g1_i7.p1  ORF type:complete len:335 (+),score=101.32 TRINITY_DN9583_c0_g1_i7:49-1005(+)
MCIRDRYMGMVSASKPGQKQPPLLVKMLIGGLSGSVGEIATIPLDTAKVRLQIQGANLKPGDPVKYKGMFGTMFMLAKEEGPLSLFKGLGAGLLRQMVFASIRIGLYDHVRDFYCGKDFVGEPSLINKILAGLTTGAFGIVVASPTDVVKIRLQAEGKLPAGVPRRYTGVFDAFGKIYAHEGIAGLWTGLVPNMARNAVINAAELATYDHTKQYILKNKIMNDNIICHFLVSAWAGFLATAIGSPIDVVKTRVMNSKKGGDGYTGVIDCIVKTTKKEGPFAFYKGFTANAWRIISWNIVMFMTREQLTNFYANRTHQR